LASIWRGSLVLGFLPVRALRWRASKVPKPTNVTFSPAATCLMMVSIVLLITCSASFFVVLASFATTSTSSALFKFLQLLSRYLQQSNHCYRTVTKDSNHTSVVLPLFDAGGRYWRATTGKSLPNTHFKCATNQSDNNNAPSNASIKSLSDKYSPSFQLKEITNAHCET
jgi:hypothetical protein